MGTIIYQMMIFMWVALPCQYITGGDIRGTVNVETLFPVDSMGNHIFYISWPEARRSTLKVKRLPRETILRTVINSSEDHAKLGVMLPFYTFSLNPSPGNYVLIVKDSNSIQRYLYFKIDNNNNIIWKNKN